MHKHVSERVLKILSAGMIFKTRSGKPWEEKHEHWSGKPWKHAGIETGALG